MLNPYSLISNDRGYHFHTDGNLSYFVYFDQGTSYFSHTKELDKLVFGFGFESTHEIEDHVFDSRIEDTIIFIFKSFFDRNPGHILTYICDAKDNNELLRFRLFNLWYHRHLSNICDKLDLKFPEMSIYGAIMFKSDNPYRSFIKEAFFKEFTMD